VCAGTALAVIVNDYYAVTTWQFENAGGTVARLQGDGVLAYFGATGDVLRQRAAVDCVESCQQVRLSLDEMAECWH
jgi:class 3 adenylate cyclase